MSYYETLGVSDKATPDEIKKAYRKLASQHHPDKGGDTKKFQEIEEAYRTLGDPKKKQQYDMDRHIGPSGTRFNFQDFGGQSHPDIDELFRHFGFGGASPFGTSGRRNKDLRVEIIIPLSSTLESQSKTISVATTNGHRETVQVSIPVGITDGTNIKYAGLGDNLFTSLQRGDLYVQITVRPDEGFGYNGIDLYTEIVVNSLVAIVGGEAEVAGLDGKVFIIKIPEGTQPDTKFRIAGQGLYQLNSSVRGDLYAQVSLMTPTVPLDVKEKIQSILNNPQ